MSLRFAFMFALAWVYERRLIIAISTDVYQRLPPRPIFANFSPCAPVPPSELAQPKRHLFIKESPSLGVRLYTPDYLHTLGKHPFMD